MYRETDFTSKAILGAAQLGLNYGLNNSIGRPSRQQAHNILEHAAEGGVRWIDTARAYGDSEQVIGDFVKVAGEGVFKVITKLDLSRGQSWEDSLKTSLGHLGEGVIHSVMFHSFHSYSHHLEDIDRIQSRMRDSGISRLGVSVYSLDEIEQVISNGVVDLIQIPLNVLDNVVLKEQLLLEAKKMGIEVHARSAFLQGAFFMSKEQIDAHPSICLISEDLERLKIWCRENKKSMQQLCLSYVVGQALISGVLVGVETLSQLQEVLAVFARPLSLDRFQEWEVAQSEVLDPRNW
jgi:aryl-alcohol dehydrogenase-like predicted oxidoreductase